MAALTMVNGNHSPPKDEANQERSPSGFTAVNGRDSAGVNGNGNTINGYGPVTDSDDRRENIDNSKAVTEATSTPSHPPERLQDTTNRPSEQNSRRPSSAHTSRISSPHKRKRSVSHDRQISPPSSYHRHSLPKSPPTRGPDNLDPRIQSTSPDGPNQPPRSAPSSYPRLDDEYDDRSSSNGTWNEHDTQPPNHTANSHSLDASDAQLAEALQRNNQEQDAGQGGWGGMRPEDDAGQESQHFHANYASDQRSSQTSQVGPKRKRVFSNRTKTGCMTCRRRKKKCDEGQPHCNNCIRGGFHCEGYTSRHNWQKPSNTKGPIPLQSKDGYPEMPGQHLTTQEMSPVSHSRHPMHHSDGSSVQPILVDDREQIRQPYIPSPTAPGPHSQGGWGKTWPPSSANPPPSQPPPPPPPPHIPERHPKDYHIPPIAEISNQHPRSEYRMMPPIRDLSGGQPNKPGMPLYQQGPGQRSDYGMPRLDMNDSHAQAQMKAKMALEHGRTMRSHPYDDTEKDKMLRGDIYRASDPALVEERERCKQALWKFNNAGNPSVGFTPAEQKRLLKEVMQPSRSTAGSPSSTSSVSAGSIAHDAIVEAPFSCWYGYNINIGNEVLISESCIIMDARPVSIGAKTWIGPRVTIMASSPDTQIQQRKGIKSGYQARPVTIEESCWIGPGATIMPGVTLHRGAYVGPNEVIYSDVKGWDDCDYPPPGWRYE